MSAISGLDIALWDLKGKRLGVPVWSLLGGMVRNKLQVYVSLYDLSHINSTNLFDLPNSAGLEVIVQAIS